MSMEKQIRDIIGQHVGGTYEAKQKAVDEILLLFSVMPQTLILDKMTIEAGNINEPQKPNATNNNDR